MGKFYTAKSVLLLCLFAALAGPISAADAPNPQVQGSTKLAVRKMLEKLSDEARIGLRAMTDECLERIAALPKAAKTQWCEEEVAKKAALQQQSTASQSAVIQTLNDRLVHCPETAVQDRNINGLTINEKIQRCKDTFQRQIESFKRNADFRKLMLQNEADQCKVDPGATLEPKCEAFESAFRDGVDAQLNGLIGQGTDDEDGD